MKRGEGLHVFITFSLHRHNAAKNDEAPVPINLVQDKLSVRDDEANTPQLSETLKGCIYDT